MKEFEGNRSLDGVFAVRSGFLRCGAVLFAVAAAVVL